LESMAHLLTDRGMGMTPTRVEAVINVAELTLVSKVSSLLRLVNCSAKFIPNLATIAETSKRLCCQNMKFEWKQEKREVFAELKSRNTCIF